MRKQVLTLLLTIGLTACAVPLSDSSPAPSATATLATLTPTHLTPDIIPAGDASIPETLTPKAKATATATPTEIPTPEISKFADITPALTLDLGRLEKLSLVGADILLAPDGKVSPAFNAWLDQLDVAGKLNNFPDARYIISADSNYGFGPQRFMIWPHPQDKAAMDLRGQARAIFDVSDDDLNMRTYSDLVRRPEVNQVYFRTKIGKTDYVLWAQKWLNRDKSTGRIIYIEDFESVRTDWSAYFDPKLSKWLTAPGFVPKNPNKAAYDYMGIYYADYWKTHQDEITQLVDRFQASPDFKITADFSQYLWCPASIYGAP